MKKTMEIERLYKDAMYFHLIHKGYTIMQAEMILERMLLKNEKFVYAVFKQIK